MRKASLAVHLVCEFAVGSAFFLPLVTLGSGGGSGGGSCNSGAMPLGSGEGSGGGSRGGSGAMPCLEAPLSPRLLFAGLLLRRLHGEHCRWLRGGPDGSSGAPSPGKHRGLHRQRRPTGIDAGRFLFQDAIFGWLDNRRDALAPAGQERPGSSVGGGRPAGHPGSAAGQEHPGSSVGGGLPAGHPDSSAGQEHPDSSAGGGRGAVETEAAATHSLAGKQRCRRCAGGKHCSVS